MTKVFSRLEKATDAETILYEIDMLRFATSELVNGKLGREQGWVYLECFLLHDRNLIEFVGKEQRHVYKTDLHVTKSWRQMGLLAPIDVDKIHSAGRKLWDKYERTEDRISRFLQHCTTQRTQFKEWEVGTMYHELEPLLQEIETAIRPARAQGPRLTVSDVATNSTASWTTYGPLLDGVELNRPATRVKPTK
jgi:hypothetical protein